MAANAQQFGDRQDNQLVESMSYAARPLGFPQQPQYQPRPQLSQQQSAPRSGMSLEDIVKSLTTNTQQFQQETKTSIHNLENQMSQFASTVNRLESQLSRKLPSQTIVNPKQNASAITLRSGKELPEPSKRISEQAIEEELEKEGNVSQPRALEQPDFGEKSTQVVTPPPPFPSRLAKSKKQEQEQEILDTFRKIEVNIPLLDAIKQIPRYAKFLKELCTGKKKLKGNEKVHMGENVSPVLQKKLPPKCKDPDFYMLDMEDDNSNSSPILLGRPFLKTTRTKIDVFTDILTMEFDGDVIKFSIYDAMKYPGESHSVFVIDVIDSLV
ncbi:uncharacterized protein [Coffea arabica]|uniref:Retrotransposon gag protein n=1 Tax=Coffea arabica TaxID=13443 RepID=A0ABM4URK9_COFAR